jgi:hypothetical protein
MREARQRSGHKRPAPDQQQGTAEPEPAGAFPHRTSMRHCGEPLTQWVAALAGSPWRHVWRGRGGWSSAACHDEAGVHVGGLWVVAHDGSPFSYGYDSGWHQGQSGEHLGDLGVGAGGDAGRDEAVVGGDAGGDLVGCEVGGQVGDGDEAAGGQGLGQFLDDSGRVLGVWDEVEYCN